MPSDASLSEGCSKDPGLTKASLPATDNTGNKTVKMETIQCQTAIVGGGVAGAYAAWRLARAGRERLGLFEYSNRVGGRLMSFEVPGIDEKAELGGMRFPSSHRRVVKLVDQFRLPHEELQVSDPQGKNLYYLRGSHFTEADWKTPAFRPPYQLDKHEKAPSPGDLLHAVALKYQHQAENLRDVGFWNLLLDEYSDEAYHVIQAAKSQLNWPRNTHFD